MWSFNKSGRDFSSRAQTAADVLTAAAEESAPSLLKALLGEECVDANQNLIAPLTLELLIFGLHLTDRIAFGRLGAGNRSGFMNALLPAIQSQLLPPLSSQLEQLYNTRNTFYGGFSKLFPEEKGNLKGTLFWEFGKALGSVYADSNPAGMVAASMFGMTFMQVINQSFDTAKVFP